MNNLFFNIRFYLIALLAFVGIYGCKQNDKQVSSQREGFIMSSDSVNLYYQIKGNGKDTIIMIHGGPGMDAEYMINDFNTLAENHVLIYYDQRGGGRSTLPDTLLAEKLLSIDKHIEDLEALRKYFKMGKMTLLGHSFGTMVTANYQIKYPDRIHKLILIGSVPPRHWDFYPNATWIDSPLSEADQKIMDSLYVAITKNIAPKENCKKFWELGLVPRLAKGTPISIVKGDLCASTAEAIWYGYKYTGEITFASLGKWDYQSELEKSTIPTLIIHGVEESIPMEMAEAWDEILPNSRLIKVEKAGHFPYAEKPDVVFPAIEEFL